ncbi:hypothetical protein J2Z83_000094 [Virgibacillus natechei]|uniref:Uncharacterized protein n=1 Tax=Virgibacillus natechei TaxID=1216297 RepID=A0ABS4IAP9_9BACI|nr:hypothetical protein [Virgibacillus natechei]MBP1968002.1 hypothetical protein [Virgibacillus natechei]UZD14715.1 hypothetical protein OLD84_09530 [Virgibacillus natechei]
MKTINDVKFNQKNQEDNTYYGEITLSVAIKSSDPLHEIQSKLDEDGLRAELSLDPVGGNKVNTEVLAVWKTEWSNMDD